MQTTLKITINTPLTTVYQWFYHSPNFAHSPLVFKVVNHKSPHSGNTKPTLSLGVGSTRTIYTAAGIFHEKITEVLPEEKITYIIERSFPPITQERTQIRLYSSSQHGGKDDSNAEVQSENTDKQSTIVE